MLGLHQYVNYQQLMFCCLEVLSIFNVQCTVLQVKGVGFPIIQSQSGYLPS